MRAIYLSILLILSACPKQTTEAVVEDKPVPITLQLQWDHQAQFAGYYAAQNQGYYKDAGLSVTILPGGVSIVPHEQVANDTAQLGIAWAPKVMAYNESNAAHKLVNIAQVFQKSGTIQVAFSDSNIITPLDFKGKKIGSWGFGNELELFAAIRKAGLDPDKDMTIVQQDFTMDQLLDKEIVAAQAETYNEFGLLLETINPKTGELYQQSDFNVISMEDYGTAMLQDGIYARADWLAQGENSGVAAKFLEASFRGWIYCRENLAECLNIVLDQHPRLRLTPKHQEWMLNKTNALIWPSPNGIGVLDQADFDQTVQIAKDAHIISHTPTDFFRTDLAIKARQSLLAEELEAFGEGYTETPVELTEGGK